jgi:hypothetical protein
MTPTNPTNLNLAQFDLILGALCDKRNAALKNLSKPDPKHPTVQLTQKTIDQLLADKAGLY